MNWEAIGAIGEILSAVGVIFTLVYLATQISQNTRALRTGAMQSYRTEAIALIDYAADHTTAFAKSRKGEELTETEKQVLSSYSQRLCGMMETVFLGHKDGTVTKEVFEGRMKGFKKAMSMQEVRHYWPRWRQYDFTDSFIEFVESEILDDNA